MVLLLRVGSASIAGRVLLAAAILPHLILEAVSYVFVALAAIFASKAMATHRLRDARFWSAIRASAVLAVLAAVGLAAAALCESALPPWGITRIAPR
jgi:hypothetical protein